MRDSVALGESSITRNSIADSGSAPFIVAAGVLFLVLSGHYYDGYYYTPDYIRI